MEYMRQTRTWWYVQAHSWNCRNERSRSSFLTLHSCFQSLCTFTNLTFANKLRINTCLLVSAAYLCLFNLVIVQNYENCFCSLNCN